MTDPRTPKPARSTKKPGPSPLPKVEGETPPKPGSVDPLKPRVDRTGVTDSTPHTIDSPLERKVGKANPTSVPGKGTLKG
jgi:hypothetical protein